MNQKTVTIDQVMAWEPCGCDDEHDGTNYTRQRVTELFASREMLIPTDIATLAIPAEDKIWALLHTEFLSEQQMHELACQFAETALPLYEQEYPDDQRPRQAIEAKRAWLRGEIGDHELAAAWAAAGDAVEAAVRAAAGDAARAAERRRQANYVRRYLK